MEISRETGAPSTMSALRPPTSKLVKTSNAPQPKLTLLGESMHRSCAPFVALWGQFVNFDTAVIGSGWPSPSRFSARSTDLNPERRRGVPRISSVVSRDEDCNDSRKDPCQEQLVRGDAAIRGVDSDENWYDLQRATRRSWVWGSQACETSCGQLQEILKQFDRGCMWLEVCIWLFSCSQTKEIVKRAAKSRQEGSSRAAPS